MPRKNVLPKYQIVSAGDMSQSSITSSVTNIQFLDNIGIQVDITTGTPTGSLAVQVSADYYQSPEGAVLNSGHWVTVTSQAIAAGAPADTYFDLGELSAPFIRLLYTKTGGTGSLDAFIVGKEI